MTTDTASTTEHIVIYGILPADEPFRSKHRYTPEQAAEIREITIKTAHSVIDEIAPGQRKVWAEPLVAEGADA